jgi:signal transduction histidine kinase
MHDREIEQVKATKEPIRGEVPFAGTFGRRIYDYILVPVFNAEGRVEAVAGTSRDVTELKDNEERLARHAALVDSLIEAAPEGLYVLDAGMRIRHANAVTYPAFGAFAPDLVGKDLAMMLESLWGKEAAEMSISVFRRTMETGEAFVVDEFSGVRLDTGATEFYDWRVERVVLPDGEYGVACYFRDISSKVAARRAIEESRDALARADARKDVFLATLAHELRNPLAPLSNCLHVMRLRDADDAEGQRLRNVMERQLATLVRMTDDLLEVSRITRGKIELRIAATDLRDVINAAIETSRPLVDAQRHRLELRMDPDTPLPLRADPVRLSQVFANLLNNAAKYTPESGLIEIEAVRMGARARVSVRDDGIGLSPAMLDRVFELFTQAEPGRQLAQGGLGIGLTLARSLVEMHGGSIEATSAGPGRGCEFVVVLPLLERAVETPEPEAGAGTDMGLDILVVDDSRENADSLAEMLSLGGHRVRIAYDGESGLQAIGEQVPDLVLLDLGMPGMDGYATCRAIRERHGRGLRVFATSGWGRTRDIEQAGAAGFDGHLVKPVDPAKLAGLIGRTASARPVD